MASLLQSESRGKNFKTFFDEVLTPLRDNIAHVLLSASGDALLSADDPLSTAAVRRWLPMIRCMARSMLIKDFPSAFGMPSR
jgi:hypothetical protein